MSLNEFAIAAVAAIAIGLIAYGKLTAWLDERERKDIQRRIGRRLGRG